MNQNPYLFGLNEEINFSAIKDGNATQAINVAISRAKESLESIYSAENPLFENTLGAFDDLLNDITKPYAAIYLMAFTHPDEDVRNDAQKNIPVVENFFTDVQLDEKLYGVLKAYSETEEAKNLEESRAKFLKETLDDFKRSGFDLPIEKRDEIKGIKNELSKISNEFDANIASFEDELLLEETDVEGLPSDYLKSRKQEDGRYKLDLSYPSYRPFT